LGSPFLARPRRLLFRRDLKLALRGPAAAISLLWAVAAQAGTDGLQQLSASSVSRLVVSGEQVGRSGVVSLADALNQVPNLLLRRSTSTADYLIAMRGVSLLDSQLALDSPIGLYLDGVYLGRGPTGAVFDLVDIERLEVWRGPQPGRFGRNAVGGAIHLVSASPDPGKIKLHQVLSSGERGFSRTQTTFNLPLDEHSALRISYGRNRHDGYLRNSAQLADSLRQPGYTDSKSVRLAFHTRPRDDVAVDYSYHHSDHRERTSTWQLLQVTDLSAFTGLDIARVPVYNQAAGAASLVRQSRLDVPFGGLQESDIDHHRLSLEWKLAGNSHFRSVSSYREWENSLAGTDHGFDAGSYTLRTGEQTRVLDPLRLVSNFGSVRSGTALSLFRNGGSENHHQISQDFQFSGEAYDGRFRYLAGVHYFQEEGSSNRPEVNVYPTALLPVHGRVTSAFDAGADVATVTAQVVRRRSTAEILAYLLDTDPDTDGAQPASTANGGGTGSAGAVTATTAPGEAARLYGVVAAGNSLDGADAAHDTEVKAIRNSYLSGGDNVAQTTGEVTAIRGAGGQLQGMGSGTLCGDANLVGGFTDLSQTLAPDANLPAGSVTVANACLANNAIVGGAKVASYDTDNKSYAVYVNGEISLSENLELAMGLRGTRDKRRVKLSHSLGDADGDGAGGYGEGRVEAGTDGTRFNYQIGLSYRFSDSLLVWGRGGTAYRSGGVSARNRSSAFDDPFSEENVRSYEMGVRSSWWEERLIVELNAYRLNYEDRLISEFTPGLGGGSGRLFNAGEQVSDGGELELILKPFSWLSFELRYGYDESEFESYPDSPLNPHDGSRAVVPLAPQNTYDAALELIIPGIMNNGRLVLRVEAEHQDEFSMLAAIGPDGVVDKRTLYHARLEFEQPLGRGGTGLSIALWGRNLDNEQYLASVAPVGPYTLGQFGALRSAGIDIIYNY